MKSRTLLVACLVFLSGLLAFLPVAEATGTGASPAPAPTAEQDAQTKKPSKQKRTTRAKQKAKKAKKAKKQRQKQAKQGKQQRHKRSVDQGRGPRALAANPPGQRRGVEIPGGPLETAVARQAQAANPGERYIVTFASESVNSRSVATAFGRQPGVIPTNIYEHAIKGFAAFLTPEAKAALEQDPRVASVTSDRKRFLAVQTMPTGINRVDADLNPTAAINGGGPGVNVDIGIIDTGIDFGHPDLNIFAWADCSGPGDPEWEGWDIDGHGTHVAGTAAAIDNADGVVGVAPGARIWAFRVMDDFGDMWDSYIIECMDLAALYANTPLSGQTLDVVNMSLGGPTSEDRCGVGDAFNDAVCGMVNAGVTTVVSAGNESDNAANYSPANIDAVITVSALADSNGLPGGGGPVYSDACTNPETDDSLASFSNFGPDVDIAAPGVGVLSTYPTYFGQICVPAAGVGYEIYPGTSMASPHVAGAAGLLLAVNPNLTPAQVKAQLQASRENVAIPGDPDGINEGILNVGTGVPGPGLGDTSGPSVAIAGPGKAKAGKRYTLRVNASDPAGISRVELYQCAPKCKKVGQDTTAPYSFNRKLNKPGKVTFKVRAYDRLGNLAEKTKVVKVKPARR